MYHSEAGVVGKVTVLKVRLRFSLWFHVCSSADKHVPGTQGCPFHRGRCLA